MTRRLCAALLSAAALSSACGPSYTPDETLRISGAEMSYADDFLSVAVTECRVGENLGVLSSDGEGALQLVVQVPVQQAPDEETDPVGRVDVRITPAAPGTTRHVQLRCSQGATVGWQSVLVDVAQLASS